MCDLSYEVMTLMTLHHYLQEFKLTIRVQIKHAIVREAAMVTKWELQ